MELEQQRRKDQTIESEFRASLATLEEQNACLQRQLDVARAHEQVANRRIDTLGEQIAELQVANRRIDMLEEVNAKLRRQLEETKASLSNASVSNRRKSN